MKKQSIRIIALTLTLCSLSYLAFSQETTEDTKPPTNAEWSINHYYKVFQVARSLNDFQAAKGALLNILVEIPQNDSIMFELAVLYFQQRQYTSSAVLSQQLLSTNPGNVAVLEMAATSYENIGAKEKAIDAYEQLYLKSDDFGTLYKLALLQFDAERFQESKTNTDILLTRPEATETKISILTTENVQKEYTVNVVLLNLRGMIMEALGDEAKAKENYNEALKIAPDFAGAKSNLEAMNK